MFGLLVLTFTIYLIQDCGSTVKIISAFPTIEYSESLTELVTQQVAFRVSFYQKVQVRTSRNSGFDDYEKGLAYAKTVNKPLCWILLVCLRKL
jgi:thiol:disulfide interchange protein DsbD